MGDERDGPHLSLVRVSAKLEVDAALLRQFQVVGLVVEQDGVFVHVGSLRQFLHGLAAAVAAVLIYLFVRMKQRQKMYE